MFKKLNIPFFVSFLIFLSHWPKGITFAHPDNVLNLIDVIILIREIYDSADAVSASKY